MTKVTIEYDDSDLLGCMFRDAITHCLMMMMKTAQDLQVDPTITR